MRARTRWPKVSGSRTRSALIRAAVCTKRVGALAPIGSARTRALVAGVALAACLLVGAARAAPTDTVSGLSPVTAYVTNSGDGTVTPIAVATNTPGTPVPVGRGPFAVAITPDGATAYVTNVDDGTVTPITLATNTPGTPIAVGSDPAGIAITPDGKTAYVSNQCGSDPTCGSDGSVTPITLATNTPGTPIALGGQSAGIAITPDGKTVYVVVDGANCSVRGSLTPITVVTDTLGTPIPVGIAPYGVAITPDGNTAYVTNFSGSGATCGSDGSVTPITLATNTPGAPIVLDHGNPLGVAITPDGKTAYVASEGNVTVTPITVATNTAGTPIFIHDVIAFAVAITPDGKTAYVTNAGTGSSSSTVIPITVATNTIGTPIPVGLTPLGIAITPAPAADNDLVLTNVPTNITVNATSPAGATVSYIPPTVVDEDLPLPTVNCLPGSGSLFPIGLTTVGCTATAAGDANSPVTATFTVTVNGAAAQLQGLLASVTGVGPGRSLADKVTLIQAYVAANDKADACGTLAAFINDVNAQTGKKITRVQAASFVAQAQNIEATLGC